VGIFEVLLVYGGVLGMLVSFFESTLLSCVVDRGCHGNGI
jgi:hypothetical protein